MGRKAGGSDAAVLAVIALGGGTGALARYGVSLWVPDSGGIAWSTLAVNVIGCFAIGVLMVCITEIWVAHRLLRPFLGIGVLGGFTTFSTYAVDVRRLLESGRQLAALGYLGGTVAAALSAVVLGVSATRWWTRKTR
ncbi:fluoride efflux transporter CrcB [Nocardia huaxiensis]|uniref:Fluoride-specific ion channel FluC n=1 Tax=Nocardia huaxiensis TaxID=2755382 RepID=A0A7D6ZK47_9NOCA|nr:fluoride efflux transporter CrcB [Nocardia huaxiensis]QLY33079.1 fluoride efflux transporter CrcB [Nocardia huaxiensis]UFS93153.1 fluoride efflux transporter CrcB [Nocardia huaxiensis]